MILRLQSWLEMSCTIPVHYGVLDVRQLVQTMDDRESAKDALISSLQQGIVDLREGFHRL